jgi:hypothetical protein
MGSQEDKTGGNFTSLTRTTEFFVFTQTLHSLGITSVDLDRGVDHARAVLESA